MKNPVDRCLIPLIIPVAARVLLVIAEAPVWVGKAVLANGHMQSGHLVMGIIGRMRTCPGQASDGGCLGHEKMNSTQEACLTPVSNRSEAGGKDNGELNSQI